MGAMGKSAQFLLHTWLPDAMEGPTPVSALIHAATMVTAGVFMVARLSPLFELSETRGPSSPSSAPPPRCSRRPSALVQNDIKRIVAYSTCSQLGYMFVAMGVGAYSIGMYHLFTHAFFKALLFLGSGSVITAMHHEQDIRMMGGLRTRSLHLCDDGGRHARADRVSADRRLFLQGRHHRGCLASTNPAAFYGYLMTLVAAGLTAFYSWRLVFKTFHGRPHDEAHCEAAHESPPTMLIPLFVLAVG